MNNSENYQELCRLAGGGRCECILEAPWKLREWDANQWFIQYSRSRFWPAWFLFCFFPLCCCFSMTHVTLLSSQRCSQGILESEEHKNCLVYISFHRIRNLKTKCCCNINDFFSSWVFRSGSCHLWHAHAIVDICIQFCILCNWNTHFRMFLAPPSAIQYGWEQMLLQTQF